MKHVAQGEVIVRAQEVILSNALVSYLASLLCTAALSTDRAHYLFTKLNVILVPDITHSPTSCEALLHIFT